MQRTGPGRGDPAFLSGALLDGWYAPALRGASGNGVGRWTETEIVAFLKTGRNKHAVVFGSMMEAFNNSTAFMTDDDLGAIAHYLKSLPREVRVRSGNVTTRRRPSGLCRQHVSNEPGAQLYCRNAAIATAVTARRVANSYRRWPELPRACAARRRR